MTYFIPMVIVASVLAWFLRDMWNREESSMYVAAVTIGGGLWPLTLCMLIWLYYKWRREVIK